MKLTTCVWCGEDDTAALQKLPNGKFVVDCRCGFVTAEYDTAEEAIAVWNNIKGEL